VLLVGVTPLLQGIAASTHTNKCERVLFVLSWTAGVALAAVTALLQGGRISGNRYTCMTVGTLLRDRGTLRGIRCSGRTVHANCAEGDVATRVMWAFCDHTLCALRVQDTETWRESPRLTQCAKQVDTARHCVCWPRGTVHCMGCLSCMCSLQVALLLAAQGVTQAQSDSQ
jgi:hypothetical protein